MPPRLRPSVERPARRRVLMALGYYDHQLHRGIVGYARQARWILDTSMAHYGVLPEHWPADGIVTLLLPCRLDVIEFVRRQRVPVVAMTSDVGDLAVPRVLLDNVRIGRLAAEHLLARGFKNLAFYQFSDIADVCQREEGFRQAVQAAGARYFHLDWHAEVSRRSRAGWFEWLKRQLARLPMPLGMMAQSDNRAAHLVSACEAMELAVPEQVAIVGVDNDEYACEFAPVPISSVDSNRQMLAYEAAALLDRLMQGQEPPASPMVIEPRGVVARRSSDILAVAHKPVARALSFIWAHYAEPISVDDVIAASRMSRCGLYRAFEKHVGHSLGDELEHKRIEQAKRLLAESSEKMYRVAALSGFSSGEHLSRAFARAVGVTPSDYRRGKRR